MVVQVDVIKGQWLAGRDMYLAWPIRNGDVDGNPPRDCSADAEIEFLLRNKASDAGAPLLDKLKASTPGITLATSAAGTAAGVANDLVKVPFVVADTWTVAGSVWVTGFTPDSWYWYSLGRKESGQHIPYVYGRIFLTAIPT